MKLVVCFPGIGYHCDKPLLYYSRKLAACAGYDHTLLLQYTYHKDGLRGSPAALREAFDTLYAQAEAQLVAARADVALLQHNLDEADLKAIHARVTAA